MNRILHYQNNTCKKVKVTTAARGDVAECEEAFVAGGRRDRGGESESIAPSPTQYMYISKPDDYMSQQLRSAVRERNETDRVLELVPQAREKRKLQGYLGY